MPFAPLIVSVELAAGVVPDVVTVSVEVPVLPVMVAGLKLAVAPVGRPAIVSATLPVRPFTAVLVTVYVTLPPGRTDCVAGVAVRVKLVTASVTDALCDRLLLLPVTVSVEFPPGVPDVVLTVKVAVPAPPVMVAGLKLAVAPAGNPLTLGVTVPVNPFTAATVTV